MSADGKIAGDDRTQVRISSDEDRTRVKGMRKQFDAVMIGVGTVLADDPHLTLRDRGYDTNPIRIVMDPHGRTPQSAQVLDDRAPTVMITLKTCGVTWNCDRIIRAGTDTIDLDAAMQELTEMGIENILVEGGGATISHLFRKRMVDRYTVFVGGLIIGGKDAPTPCDGSGWVAENGIRLRMDDCQILGNGALLTFLPIYD